MEFLSSPNHDARDGHPVDMLVLHYTGMPMAADALARLTDPSARVSSHYLIDEEGMVYRLVEEERRAWHAGVSHWRGQTNINQRSIGIEIANPGHEWGYRPFPEAQMKAVAALCRDILSRHAIPPRNVVGHSDVAPARKLDPGELFDWKRLAGEGIGLWPGHTAVQIDVTVKSLAINDKSEAVRTLQQSLTDYGYGVQIDGLFDAVTEAVVSAFQRHFRPEKVDGVWDAECAALLAALLVYRHPDESRDPALCG